MTPQSGAISFSQIATELGISTTNISLGNSTVRQYAFVSTGAIGFNDCRGIIKHTQATSVAGNPNYQYTATLATNYGWNSGLGPYKLTYIVNSGVYLYASAGSYEVALNCAGNGYINLINNGYLVGSGGTGGNAGGTGNGGQPGVPGISVNLTAGRPLNITNNGVIGGGGGGGGSGYDPWYSDGASGGGGGGGFGGAGYGYCGWAGCGDNGADGGAYNGGNGGSYFGAPGGAGANPGSPGAATPNYAAGGGGGGSGASGGTGGNGGGTPGGSGGNCTSTSSGTITWVTAGTRYGNLG